MESSRVRQSGEVERLAGDLGSDDPVRREAAVARLRVIGKRAVRRLTTLATDRTSSAAARSSSLAALEGIDDPRVISPAVAALISATESGTALAAIAVLRNWVAREEGTRVLDALAAAAVDDGRPGEIRQAALDALAALPRELIDPVRARVESVVAAAPAAEEAQSAREWLETHAADAPLSALHDLVVRARQREQSETTARRRSEWLSVRASAHALLARRGSRVALYDLREAFDVTTAPLPLDFLAAVTAVGDASCLEPMARNWARSTHDRWWRERLESAAAEIVHRTRLSGRSAVIRRIRSKWSGFI